LTENVCAVVVVVTVRRCTRRSGLPGRRVDDARDTADDQGDGGERDEDELVHRGLLLVGAP
jgi:hypothetical protein